MSDEETLEQEQELEVNPDEEENTDAAEPAPPPAVVVLSDQMAADGLSLVCKVGNNLEHAYVKLMVQNRELTDVSEVAKFPHLRYVDFTNNSLETLTALAALQNLLTLHVDHNKLKTIDLPSSRFLQVLSATHNALSGEFSMPPQPLLRHLLLSHNEISSFSVSTGMFPALRVLELRANKLQSLTALSCLSGLEKLYVAENELSTLEGLNALPALKLLHARANKVATLVGASQSKQLHYLNLRDNAVESVEELKHLTAAPLHKLVLSGNIIADAGDYRLQALVCIPTLVTLDKDTYEEDERNDASEARRQQK
eukprot:m.6525 g.6525  ORF g.6525 m.6525 type:complete len:312 (-) comp4221_c0_seq1:21-956(-)